MCCYRKRINFRVVTHTHFSPFSRINFLLIVYSFFLDTKPPLDEKDEIFAFANGNVDKVFLSYTNTHLFHDREACVMLYTLFIHYFELVLGDKCWSMLYGLSAIKTNRGITFNVRCRGTDSNCFSLHSHVLIYIYIYLFIDYY